MIVLGECCAADNQLGVPGQDKVQGSTDRRQQSGHKSAIHKCGQVSNSQYYIHQSSFAVSHISL